MNWVTKPQWKHKQNTHKFYVNNTNTYSKPLLINPQEFPAKSIHYEDCSGNRVSFSSTYMSKQPNVWHEWAPKLSTSYMSMNMINVSFSRQRQQNNKRRYTEIKMNAVGGGRTRTATLKEQKYNFELKFLLPKQPTSQPNPTSKLKTMYPSN